MIEWVLLLLLILGCLALVLAGVGFLYLYMVTVWTQYHTQRGRYFCAPLDKRRRLKRWLQRHRKNLEPFLCLLGRLSHVRLQRATFRFQGVAGPKGSCSPESFRRAVSYKPEPCDLFLVSQLRCGTTWLQQLAYQVLVRGREELAAQGKTLGAVSPWLESVWTLPPPLAPLIGVGPAYRLIKTHFPIQLCPFSPQARYIYITRHPLDCFASCLDYLRANLGPFQLELAEAVEWFCSLEWMWWTPWPYHVAGWWQRAQTAENVLFLTYEQMIKDLPGIAQQIANFLGLEPLNEEELAAIKRHSSFGYMREHSEAFEMAPPHLLQSFEDLFLQGRPGRHSHLPEEAKSVILEYCRSILAGQNISLGGHYPDLV